MAAYGEIVQGNVWNPAAEWSASGKQTARPQFLFVQPEGTGQFLQGPNMRVRNFRVLSRKKLHPRRTISRGRSLELRTLAAFQGRRPAARFERSCEYSRHCLPA